MNHPVPNDVHNISRPLVTVVIPSYGQKRTIRQAIETLIRQDYDNYEIIIVDCSADETRSIIEEYAASSKILKLIRRSVKTPAAMQRNIGIEAAKGEIILTADTDCVFSKTWISDFVKAFDKGFDIVGGSVGNANPAEIIGWVIYFVEFNEYLPCIPSREMIALPSCNMGFRRSVVSRHGMFPDVKHSADIWFTRKLSSSGEKILFDPKVRVLHSNRTGLADVLRLQYRYGRSSCYFRKRVDTYGSFLSRNPFMLILVIPYRFIRILILLAGCDLLLMLLYLAVSPIIILTLTAWALGFFMEAIAKTEAKGK